MTADRALMQRPIGELATLVKSRACSARELVDASLDAIDERDGEINAFVDVYDDHARAEADAINADDPRPFAGVPIAIKNNRAVAGQRLMQGARLCADVVATKDAALVRRLRGAGFVIVGSTTLPEFGGSGFTRSVLSGVTRNPLDPERIAGGSSGGAGAAVAAGMVPIAHGNDGAGSIRIPAACCGLVGLKSQRNRISPAPHGRGELLTVDGVISRTVPDTALALDVLAGPELGDEAWAPPPIEPFAHSSARVPARLRIALTTTPPTGAAVDADGVRGARETAARLESLGHEIVEVDVPWELGDMGTPLFIAFALRVAASIEAAAQAAHGRAPQADDVEPISWLMYEMAQRRTAADAYLAESRLLGFAARVVRFIAGYDAVLTPSLATAPPLHDELDPCDPQPIEVLRRSSAFTPFFAIVNLLGSPSITLPIGQRADELPLSVQLIGQPAGEGALLALATQVEAVVADSYNARSATEEGSESHQWPT